MQPETWLDIQAEHAPERTALVAEGVSLTYAELRELARDTAAGLQEAGLGAGSRVAAGFEPGIEYVRLIHALLMLGATLCPLDPRDPAHQAEYDMKFGAADDIPVGDGEQLALNPGPFTFPICEITSSGSTGQPKRITLTGQNVFWNALGSAHALGVGADDRWLVCLPLFHVSGLMPIYRGAIYGTAVSIHPGFAVERVAREMSAGGVTGVSLVPTALIDLIDRDLGALRKPRTVLVGGAATPTALVEEAISSGIRIAVTYGMTEASSQVSVLSPGEVPDAIGSVGRPLVTSRVRIDDGQILIGGPTVSASVLDEDGWFRTGDLGRVDPEGRLWIEGRADEMLITGGENVFPGEIESVLMRHPDVRQAVAYGVDDPRWQQELRAAVVLAMDAEFDQESLLSWCAGNLPPHKVPKRIEEIVDIPLGPTGKPARSEMAKRSSGKPR